VPAVRGCQSEAMSKEHGLVSRRVRAERAIMDAQRERQTKRDVKAFKTGIRNAQVAVQRSLHCDPILKSAVKERDRRLRAAADGSADGVGAALFSSALGASSDAAASGGAAATWTGGHSVAGNDALRRARAITAKALAQIGSTV